MEDMAPAVGLATSGFGIEPDPERYGLLDLAVMASILFLAAAILSTVLGAIWGFGGSAAGPADTDAVADDDVDAAGGGGVDAAGDDV
jgi:hypothetical protein